MRCAFICWVDLIRAFEEPRMNTLVLIKELHLQDK